MSLGNAVANQNIVRPTAKPVTQQTGNLAAGPYINISPAKIANYLEQIPNLKEDAHSPFKSETRRPLKEETTPQVAAQTVTPEVLKLHPDPVQAEEYIPSFEQAPGASTPQVLAALIKGLKGTPEFNELREAFGAFRNEQRIMQGAMAA